jgi:cell wall-associated NlpC family hydrolase
LTISEFHFKEKILDLDGQIKDLVKEKYSDIKINTVKLLLGALVVASIPFSLPAKVKAVVMSPSGTQASATSGFTTLNTTGTVLATKLNVRSGPSTDYSIVHKLWLGNKVKVVAQSTYWYKIRLSDGRTGWVRKTYLKIDMTQQKVNTVISTAESLIGTPYVWGGESLAEGGFDCSGFTQYVYGKAGVTLSRISTDQAKQGIAVARANIQPGDLIFYSFAGDGRISHVGIYIGGGRMIHSPKTGDVVKVTDITTEYWRSRFVTARRVI